MRSAATLFLATACLSFGQPVVAPTEPVSGPPRGREVGAYNVVNSFELGVRFRDVNGNLGKYRSDVNFGNGLRLLGSQLSVHSRDGHGKYFDELSLNTQGLGNDPYQVANFRVQKNGVYRYDLLWRENAYYNPALPIANGQHLRDTTRRLQDHSIVLLPQAPVRLHAGYSRMGHGGAGLSTVQLFDQRGDEFPLFMDVRRSMDEYRLGFDVDFAGVKLTAVRGWEFFKDDSRHTSPQAPGNSLEDLTRIDAFRRDEPYHGETDSWRVNLLIDRSKLFNVNARYTWAGTQRGFIFDELVTGTDRIGAARNRQILLFGTGNRPVSAGNLTLTFYPTQAVTLVNHTSFHHTRMEGDGSYRELSNATLDFAEANFNFLGIRTIATSTDFNLRATDGLTFFAGHHFSTRRIRSIEEVSFEGTPDRRSVETDNELRAARTGIRLRWKQRWSLILDGELGRSDRPIYPISERDYHALSGRLQYRNRNLNATIGTRTLYNNNSTSILAHSSRSRNYFADLSWSPRAWMGFDANYSKLHLDTLSGIVYFYSGARTQDLSAYVSNIHSGSLMTRFAIRNRVDLFAGFTLVEDAGGSYPGQVFVPITDVGVGPTGTIGFQRYPLSFTSPMARVSVRLHQRLRWNAGYQFYRYDEELFAFQNYRAHTGFSSLSWSF